MVWQLSPSTDSVGMQDVLAPVLPSRPSPEPRAPASVQVMRRLDRWHHTQLWPEDMPRRALVVICGSDVLLPVPQVLGLLAQSTHPPQVRSEPLCFCGIVIPGLWLVQMAWG